MKTRTILIVCALYTFLFYSDTVSAQWNRSLHVIPQYGGIVDQVENYDFDHNFIGRTGWQLGLHVRKGNALYIQSGIEYFRLSRELFADRFGWDYEQLPLAERSAGVTIPVLFGFDLLGWSDFGIRGYAGPSLAFYKNGESRNIWRNHRWGVEVGWGFDLSVVALDFSYNFSLDQGADDLLQRSDFFAFKLGFLIHPHSRYHNH